ncbi:MAG TPA: TIGR03087 family PEP-CTERM/XrtA system glycosyltransferase [Sphingomonas sp.]|nr:TIGR03087 family PEP-CTERM/XrtA system glycosyltransferase [Sphingomonas sp.]
MARQPARPADRAGTRLMGDVLFLAHRVPYPPDRGDKIRSYHLLRHIAAYRRVHLVAFADDDASYEAPLAGLTASCTIVRRRKGQVLAAGEALLTRRPVSLTAFAKQKVHQVVKEILTTHDIETVFVFSGQMAQYLPAALNARVVMDFVDMDSAKFVAYAEEARGPMRWMLAREARLLGAFERAIAARADTSMFVSDAEAAVFRAQGGEGHVVAVENGIDTGCFDPAADFERVSGKGPLIVFTGQMDYRPNVDAVVWFAEEVLPRVRQAVPGARFAIVGRKPDRRVAGLARLSGVTVTGAVADVRGWLAAASVVVAPLKLARGVQNKVLEAMAMARPVVASPAAAEGIDHDGTISVAGNATEFGLTIKSLLENRDKADEMGRRARSRVVERYGWDARLAALDPVMGFSAVSAERSAA